MNMKKQLSIIVLFLLASFAIKAQNTVITDDGTYTGSSSAMLDVKSTTKGLLIPRVTATGDVSSPAIGLLVYQTGGTAGFYYYDGSTWKFIGNTTNGDNFGDHIATTNIQLNNNYLSNDGGNEGIRVDNSGKVGINNSTPDYTLDISGNLRIEGSNKLYFYGTGSSDADVTLYRGAADRLQTDDAFKIGGNLILNDKFISNDGGDEGIRIDNSGNVYIGAANSNHLFFVKTTTKNRAIGAQVSTTTGENYSFFAQTDGVGATRNCGLYGLAAGGTFENFGILGNTTGTGTYNFGLNGTSTGAGGSNTSNYGVNGYASLNTYSNVGVWGEAASAGSYLNGGVVGAMSVAGGNNVGVFGRSFSTTSGGINIAIQGYSLDYDFSGGGGYATDIAFYGVNGHVVLDNVTNSAAELRFVEPNTNSYNSFYDATNNYTAFKAQAQSTNITYTLPASDGSSGAILSTNGSGSLSWTNNPSLPITTKTTSYTATSSDYTIIGSPSSAKITITLPAAASSTGQILIIKNISGSYDIDVKGNSSENIDGINTQTISTQYGSLTLQCDGSAWYIISSK